MSDRQYDFRSLLGLGRFMSGVGWVAVGIGAIVFSIGLVVVCSSGRGAAFGGVAVVGGALLGILGFLVVACGQVMSCFVTIERNTRGTYELLRESRGDRFAPSDQKGIPAGGSPSTSWAQDENESAEEGTTSHLAVEDLQEDRVFERSVRVARLHRTTGKYLFDVDLRKGVRYAVVGPADDDHEDDVIIVSQGNLFRVRKTDAGV